jgi:hypothetical protein
MDIVERIKAREIAVSAAGGTAALAGTLNMGPTGDVPSAFPSAICGAEGLDPDNCLRTIAPDVYYGNQDSQRLAPGSTLVVECFVDGCGVGIGDVHGAQGDGEVSITAVEIEANVKVSIRLIKPGDPMCAHRTFDCPYTSSIPHPLPQSCPPRPETPPFHPYPRYALPSPTTVGTTSVMDYSPTAFVSFHGFGDKPLPIPAFVDDAVFPWPIQQHITFGDAVANMTFVADNLQLSGRNALCALARPHPGIMPRPPPPSSVSHASHPPAPHGIF